MHDRSFPSWAGPLVGTIAGAVIAARVRFQNDGPGDELGLAGVIAIGAALGFVGGLFVWALDPAWSATGARHEGETPAALVPRVLAALSLLLCCIPVAGLGLGIAAIVFNKEKGAWPARVAGLGVLFSAITTLVFIIILVTDQ